MEPPHCNYFVIRKKRFCRISIIPGGSFCAEHQPLDDKEKDNANDKRIRIVCPLDPKHTCYAHNLKKHLKICNARPRAPLPFIEKDVNVSKKVSLESNRLLSEFNTADIRKLIDKIEDVYPKLGILATKRCSSHKIVEDEMLKPYYGPKSKKHLKQASSILGILQEEDLIKNGTCFVEFGAGRGQLSYWLAQAAPLSSFLIVERASPKHKKDNKLEKIERIRMDIADLILEKVETVVKSNGVFGVTKHLCGDATDLALRCLCNMTNKDKILGCLMTFCCHHRCSWDRFVGQEFLESLDFSQMDFEMMCGMSSWMTCGTGFSRDKKDLDATVHCNNARDKEIGLNRQQKGDVGLKCKMLLNWGRLKFLEGLGFTCDLLYYVDNDISLENVCILAKN